MSKLDDAEKKVQFAEYLIRSNFMDGGFPSGAVKHLVSAANLAVQALTDMDEKLASSPRFIQQNLQKFDEPALRGFSKVYMELWQLANSSEPSRDSVLDAIRKTREFMDWVRKVRTDV